MNGQTFVKKSLCDGDRDSHVILRHTVLASVLKCAILNFLATKGSGCPLLRRLFKAES